MKNNKNDIVHWKPRKNDLESLRAKVIRRDEFNSIVIELESGRAGSFWKTGMRIICLESELEVAN